MGNRSYFTYEGRECAQPGFGDRAIAELTKRHVGSFNLESAQLYAWQQELGAPVRCTPRSRGTTRSSSRAT